MVLEIHDTEGRLSAALSLLQERGFDTVVEAQRTEASHLTIVFTMSHLKIINHCAVL
jgi:acetolactate synthase small subunit